MFPKYSNKKNYLHSFTCHGIKWFYSFTFRWIYFFIYTNKQLNQSLWLIFHIKYFVMKQTNMFAGLIEMLFMRAACGCSCLRLYKTINASENHFITIVVIYIYLILWLIYNTPELNVNPPVLHKLRVQFHKVIKLIKLLFVHVCTNNISTFNIFSRSLLNWS